MKIHPEIYTDKNLSTFPLAKKRRDVPLTTTTTTKGYVRDHETKRKKTTQDRGFNEKCNEIQSNV